ncbi:MAG: reverse transcriptase family protein, partial [Cyanobacteria bacterium J06553_1]
SAEKETISVCKNGISNNDQQNITQAKASKQTKEQISSAKQKTKNKQKQNEACKNQSSSNSESGTALSNPVQCNPEGNNINNNDVNSAFFFLTHAERIPPFHSLLLPVCTRVQDLKQHSINGSAVVDPKYMCHNSLSAPPGLYKIEQGFSKVHIINMSKKSLFLRPGTKLMEIEYTSLPIECHTLPESVFCGTTTTDNQNAVVAENLKATTGVTPLEFNAHQILEDLFTEFNDILPSKNRPLGKTTLLQHSIKLIPGAQPVNIPAYRIPHSKKLQVDKEVEGMLAQDIIEESVSPWSSPLLLVPKSDGSFRPVVDYRALNQLTISQPFPMPKIKDLLSDINRNNKIFSSIDLAKGFLQVPLDPESRPYTAFTTRSGHFQFKSSPMGLKNSPSSFLKLMTVVMQGLLSDDVLVYLDDLLICSENVSQHTKRLKEVFKRLQSAHLTINPTKCKFFQKELTFLGHTISNKGILPNELKVIAVKNFPTPTNEKQIKQFIGMAGFYRSFIWNFGELCTPLTSLLKKDVKFEWGESQELSFNALKSALTTAPILTFPDYNQKFHLYTDASNTGLGAVLMQIVNNQLQPIAFASRVLNKAERNYATTDREMLGVVWGLKHFREIIMGYKINLYTDHNPLVAINSHSYKDPHGRIARYILTLNDFEVEVKYIKGTLNTPPDALSRINALTSSRMDLADSNPKEFPPSFAQFAPKATTCHLFPSEGSPQKSFSEEEIKQELSKDPVYKLIIKALEEGSSLPKFKNIPV